MADPTEIVLKFFLEYTKEYLEYNFRLIAKANDNAVLLQKQISDLSVFVVELTKKSKNNKVLEKLAIDVQQVICLAEDTADKFIVYYFLRKHGTGVYKFFNVFGHWKKLHSIGVECEELKVRINNFYDKDVPNATKAAALLNTAGETSESKEKIRHHETDRIFGLDDVADDLRKRLFGGSEELEVHAIVGMAGLGKTTAAYKIYNDAEIENKFTFARAFVTVSMEYDKKEVFLKILGEFVDITSEIRGMDEETIKKKVKAKLEPLQYLIVMDDVWTDKAWDALQEAFPRNKKHSRVLITTRENHVADHANPSVKPLQMRYMYRSERKELLHWKVFGNIGCPESIKAQISQPETLILEKSGGLPLAIVIIAGLLVDNKMEPEHWAQVSQRVKNFDHAKEEQSTDLIRYSFDHLPYYLKQCFLYLGVFPEDFEIPVWRLLRLWMAEGFVQGEGNLEKIAEGYLLVLVNKNLVMAEKKRWNGTIKTCRLHDFMRVFCKGEAMREKVFQEIKGISDISLDEHKRIAINNEVKQYVGSKLSDEGDNLKLYGGHVRSFLSFTKTHNELPNEHTQNIARAFPLLRVLDVERLKLKEFPPNLYHLVLLKSVTISCDIDVLHKEFSLLWNLQTIIIKTSHSSLRINADIWQMKQLRHIHCLNTYVSLLQVKEEVSIPPAASKLQTLSSVAPESCTKAVFQRCRELKKLGIQGNLEPYVHGEEGRPGLLDYLSILESLENLKLINAVGATKLPSLPLHNKFPSSLTKLTLCRTKLEWKHISTLGKLKGLRVLKLKDEAFVGDFWVVEDKGLPLLRVLHIDKTDLLGWTASASDFQNLTALTLKDCAQLIGIPDAFADIELLMKIDMSHCSSSAVQSGKEIKKKKKEKMLNTQDQHSPRFRFSFFPPDS